MKNRQTGFTLIELIVVILILSILAATALPRFIDVTGDAHTAAVSGAAGGLGAAVALGHAQWVANQSNEEAAVAGFGDGLMVANAEGWLRNNNVAVVVGTEPVLSCIAVWENAMLNPPSVSAPAGSGEYTTVDTPAGDVCTYTYAADASGVITYDSDNGSVTFTAP